MMADGAVPDFGRVFGELRVSGEDEARSVYSPAAYFVELLGLLEGTFDQPGLLTRRPDLKKIVLNAENTFGETAYLDIVNEVLERLVGDGPYEKLLNRKHPFVLPFSVHGERLRKALEYLQVTPEELYRLFAAVVDHEVAGREYLGVSVEEARVIVNGAEVPEGYGLAAGEEPAVLRDTRRFKEATGLGDAELRELVALGTAVTLNEDETLLAGTTLEWLSRAHRLIRLSRAGGLTLTETDLVVNSFCGGLINGTAIVNVAAVVRLGRTYGTLAAEICGLVVPWIPAEDQVVEVCAGDILTPANRDYRYRLAVLIGLAEPEIVTIVQRYRERYADREPSPFDRGAVGLPEISLIRRAGLLARALGLGAGELFDVLIALESDPSLQRYSAFAVLGGPGPETPDLHKVFEGGRPVEALWLVQTLFVAAGWMREAGFDGAELAQILGGRPESSEDELRDLFDRLHEDLGQVALSPRTLASERFGERAVKVIHDVVVAFDKGVVAAAGSRLLDIERTVAETAAYRGVTDLGVIFASDFEGLGLGERLQEKIFRNLVFLGYLRSDGTLAVAATDAFDFASDFTDLRETIFKTIGGTINGVAALYPSDLEQYDSLGQELRDELYDNMIFNGYVEENGDIVVPDFFLNFDNVANFDLNAHLADAVEPVIELIDDRLATFEEDPLYLDQDLLTPLRLSASQQARLLESLRFNGHLDADDRFTDKAALAALSPQDFGVSAEFAGLRTEILDVLQDHVAAFLAELTTFTTEDFAELADKLASRRVYADLDGVELRNGRVLAEENFDDPEGTVKLGSYFGPAEQDLVFGRIVEVLQDEAPYRLSRTVLTDLGLTEEAAAELRAYLVATGHLTDRSAVAQGWLPYFADTGNSLDFGIPGMEDYSREVFFLLQPVAIELTTAVDEVSDRLIGLAQKQKETLYASLADVFGLAQDTTEALIQCVAGGEKEAMRLLAGPALDEDELPDDPRLRLGHRRIRRFALLAAKLGLEPALIRAVFHDQDLVGKFPEPLALPPGLTRFEALLDSGDGTIYLFGDGGYWTYSGSTYARISPVRKPLTDLWPSLVGLVAIDAAFVRPDGTEWLVGHDAQGVTATFTREPGGIRWARKAQTWGKIKNNFTDPARIDSAFVDSDGRTYLFAGDQYIRYTNGYDAVDEGYPRDVTEWWQREGLEVPDPGTVVDACFQDPDGVMHLFSGDRWLTVEGIDDSALTWGKVRPTFEGLKRLDAAYAAAASVHLLTGAEALRYSDSVENHGVLADEGVQRALRGVPPQFESGVEAALTAPDGVLHLFRDGKTIALTGGKEIVPTADRWGVLAPPLKDGAVDAAFAGLDGKTYLFSGGSYLRYSTADYTRVDDGYPQAIGPDWGGLTQVDASFIMDGRTYLFGAGGVLFDLPPEYLPDLDAGMVTPVLRNLFQAHGLTLTGISGKAPEWVFATGEGITLPVRKEGLRVKVHGDGSRFYVRYSTLDYRTPDQGFPKPLSDNWWNMPDSLRLGPIDAVFTGRDNHTYLFAADKFVRFDARHRWWSEPMPLSENWDSIPFTKVDAGFVGVDGRTYLFSGTDYARYSTDDYTQIDDGHPARISSLWGHVFNNLARTGRVDAALVLDVTETVDGVEVPRTRTYLFSGDQYVRYSGAYDVVDEGYPRKIINLVYEPGLTALPATLDGVDAAFSDRRTAYLVRGGMVHAVSAAQYRRYDDIALGRVRCAFIEDGSIMAEYGSSSDTELPAENWVHLSALEGRTVTATGFRPRTLRPVPQAYKAGLDSVLKGADGNTYLFKGPACFNVHLNADYPITEEWGRLRNEIYETGAVDAAFVGRDGRTYLFSGDQFVVYPDTGTTIEGDPQPIADHWAGLTSVTLAYVRDTKTYLFEKPDTDGRIRYLLYEGKTYTDPVEGTTDESFFQAPDGFPFPEAVLFEGSTMTLLAGEDCVSFNQDWSRVRPIERLYPGFGQGLDAPDGLRTAFRALDGTTYFFFEDSYAGYREDSFGPLSEVRERWGLSRNPFLAQHGTVDAAFVWRGQYTYLFSGDRYVRYTGKTYRHVDPGYPKPIAGELRKEQPFSKLAEAFDDALGNPIDAVIGNDRTIHILIGGACHTLSPEPAASFSLRALGQIRNTLADTGKVDATLVSGRRVYLFSGDQYVRYSGHDRTYVDDGYPRALSELPSEFGLSWLPTEFQDGLDSAFLGADGVPYLFKDRHFLANGIIHQVAGQWGQVPNNFDQPGLSAAFTAPSGELYAFHGGQYVRYSAPLLDLADEGYPRTVRDDWGDLPPDFEAGPDGAFVLDGRTYLLKDDRYVRYSGDYDTVDRTFPQQFRHRWSGTADYRLSDVHTIVRFTELCRSRPEGLAAFFLDGAQDPYSYLADLFGWDIEEVRWARRNMGLLRAGTREEHLFEIEFLLNLVDLFKVAVRAGAGPAELHTTVWAKLYGPSPDLDAAATALYGMLERRVAAPEWKARFHNELNVLKRDALVAYLAPASGTSRDLYEQYLIDVDMGGQGTTSRVREAIAATQLYLQRYLLGLEQAALPADVDPEEVKARLRLWWTWMRNYRTWEANRKVFIYPENYLRPELRARNTPAFKTLQDDLLQGEITAETVKTAYKRYLDEYTEVSRLAIAGGYVYTADNAAEGDRKLVLFGRTRTEPRRYYYRTAEFRGVEKLSATWAPWLKVDVQIAAERVDPVHAFGRVFVFWPVVEAIPQTDPSKTSITTTTSGSTQQVSAPPPHYQVKIYYSFCNLNGEWMPAQVLAVDAERTGPITGVSLYVQASRKVGDNVHDSIVVQCFSTIDKTEHSSAFTLTPELYGLPAKEPVPPPRRADLTRIFMEPAQTPVTEGEVVRFNAPADSQDGPWFSIDHKGGSFLVRPVPAPSATPAPQPLKGNSDRLPTTWDRIDAAFRLSDGTQYFFDSAGSRFIAVPPDKQASRQARQATADRFGIVGTNLVRTGAVDAALLRGDQVFLFSGDEYYRYPAQAFGTLDAGYPKKIETNTENLPRWTKIDAAFTGPGGVEVFYSRAREGFVISGALTNVRNVGSDWKLPKSGLDRVFVNDGRVFLIFGDQYIRLVPDLSADRGPRPLAKNPDGVPEGGGPAGPVLRLGQSVITFDNTRFTYTVRTNGTDEAPRPSRGLGRVPTEISTAGNVTAAYIADGRLYLIGTREFVRYTLAGGSIPEYIDAGYPKKLAQPVEAVFTRDNQRYVFGQAGYAVLGNELDSPLTFLPYKGNWRALPPGFPQDFTGALEGDNTLFLFLGDNYAAYPADDPVRRPFEIATLPSEIVRLTSSTAYELNRRLLTGGVDALLDPSTQELNELPAFSTTGSNATTIQVKPALAASVPVSSHLDFDSSNGLYYWEIFFHAPLLIAQTLNEAQRFEDARRWYEYVFDPTRPIRYWRFLPFLATDVNALVAGCRQDLAEIGSTTLDGRLDPILDVLEALAPGFRRVRDLTEAELDKLKELEGTGLNQVRSALPATALGLAERVELIAQLRRQYSLMGDRRALLQTYLDDPFDPHAIAELRPEAYRRAVVMGYVDNLLDWGDMLFRQYTAESVDEARMLYIYAYDLLGKRPVTLGPAALPAAAPYELTDGDGPGETVHLTADGTLLEGAGEVHAGIANPYFHVPGNEVFLEYWNRVEDRLTKIRASLDILGISRPLPLFDPPADVMALVRGAAGGLTTDQITAAAAAPLPAYRFDFVHQRAKELADRLKQLGADLLEAIDRRDSEELTLLRQRQDAEILALTRQLKETQIKIAEENLAGSRAALDGAARRADHYQKLIAEGLTSLQETQLAMMSLGAAGHFAAGGLKIGAAIASGIPQALIGPFIMGTSVGGDQVGDALDVGADASSALAEGFSMIGELLGIRAEQESTQQDWDLQLATSRSDIVQIGHQVTAGELQVASARRELEIHLREAAHLDTVTDFLTAKFAGAQLFGWMVGQVSGLYFQTYQLAYDTARAAERAFEAERGSTPGLIQPTYWDSRRKGLLAGDKLSLDLDRLGQAYFTTDARGLEITKRVSLLQTDALALLALKTDGRCEFALTETLFDRDFPGHYRRQIKSVSVAFVTAEGPVQANATLTQLDSKTVLEPDPKAVRFLLDPKGTPPRTLRSGWGSGGSIALSEIEEGREDSGLFELRFDDPRYLPFEGTGAVSRWRLTTRRPPDGLLDVVITVRYSADNGGDTFATAVRGMLKPYPSAVRLDVPEQFPEEWAKFLQSDTGELQLPITPDLLPGLSGRLISGLIAQSEGDTFLLNGDTRLALSPGRLLNPPGLTVGSRPWRLTLPSEPAEPAALSLILLYRATPSRGGSCNLFRIYRRRKKRRVRPPSHPGPRKWPGTNS
ncbi:MAG: hypothetical protein JWN52_5382 [Actinomycetia bacterium]|nr:hypothetical protein [Actinomycetes bacterium]